MPGEIFCSPPNNIQINNTRHWIQSAHAEKFNRIENEKTYDVCNVYGNVEERLQNSSALGKDVNECTSFEHRPKYNSLIHQYDLLCSREALLALTQSFHLLGVLLGGILANFMLKA